ncbi:MAG TPA: hypothetical protein VM493_10045 [Vicinamibacterales bacterium]|nr:hypothetical protein [Vicinamibacterales bacterium]
MIGRRVLAAVFTSLLLAGTIRDTTGKPAVSPPGVLAADLHVHPFPGDGVLTVGQLQREATRRGLDVIAVAGHNNRVALALAHAVRPASGSPIILQSQELTAPDFHMIAVGVRAMIDWRLTVSEAVRAIHEQGGAAIAAHPVRFAWKPEDRASLSVLDGVEVAHPMAQRAGSSRREIDAFFARVQSVNPDVAPIGSTDFHTSGPLGLCRTYLLTSDRSAEGAIEAIRQGRTVAQDQFGRLFGRPEAVAEVRRWLAASPAPAAVPLLDRLIALAALAILGAAVSWRQTSSRR